MPPRPPFVLAETSVRAGSRTQVQLRVARLPTGDWVSVPVIVVHGRHEGPTLWLGAAVHGDELNGIVVAHEVVQRVDEKQLRGTLLAVPMVNVFGVIHRSRYLPDRRDLNRCFPGSARGSLGARLAHLVSKHVIEAADVGIDLHTGSDGRRNLPQIRGDLDNPETARLAHAFGAPVVLHAALRDGSVRAHAAGLNKPVLVYEAGEATRIDDGDVKVGTHGVLRVMHAMSMLDSRPRPAARQVMTYRASAWVRASRSGFCRLGVELGARVVPGQPLATVMSPGEGRPRTILAKQGGVVIGIATVGLVSRGDALVHVATGLPGQTSEESEGEKR